MGGAVVVVGILGAVVVVVGARCRTVLRRGSVVGVDGLLCLLGALVVVGVLVGAGAGCVLGGTVVGTVVVDGAVVGTAVTGVVGGRVVVDGDGLEEVVVEGAVFCFRVGVFRRPVGWDRP